MNYNRNRKKTQFTKTVCMKMNVTIATICIILG